MSGSTPPDPSSAAPLSRSVRGVGYSVMGSLVPALAAFCAGPLIAHELGVGGRGEASAATAPMLLAANLFTLGLPDALTYFVARRSASAWQLFGRACRWIVPVGVTGSIVLYLLAPTLSAGDADLMALMRVVAAALTPALVATLIRGVAIGRQQWRRVALDSSLGQVLRLVALLLLAALGQLTVSAVSIATAAATFIGVVAYIRRPSTRNHHVQDRPVASTRAILRFGAAVWAGSISGVLFLNLDQVLMTPLSSHYELGLYAVAVALSQTASIPANAARGVLFSVEARSPDLQRLANVSRQSALMTFIVAIPIGAVAPIALDVLFGHGFIAAEPMVYILLASAVLGANGSVAGLGLSARGRPWLRTTALTCGFITNLLFIILLVPSTGGVGASWATLVGSLTTSLVNIALLHHVYDMRIRDFFVPRAADFRTFWVIGAKSLSAVTHLRSRRSPRPES